MPTQLTKRRDKWLKCRVTKLEQEQVMARISEMGETSLSDYLRGNFLSLDLTGVEPNPPKVVHHYKATDPALLRQLAAIGSNLNQVSRWCNSRKPIEAVEVAAALAALSREVEALRASQD